MHSAMFSVFRKCKTLHNKNLIIGSTSSYFFPSKTSLETSATDVAFHKYSSVQVNLCQIYNGQFLGTKSNLYSHLVKKRYFSKKKGSSRVEVEQFRKMPIDLYQTPASPPCHALMMTANYLGIKLNKKFVDLWEGEQMKPEYLRMNPLHTVPTIDDGGFYLWESRAIQTYLVNKYAPDSPIYPKDPQARAIVDRMLYFDIGTLYKAESEYLFPQMFEGQPADPEKEETFKKALALLEEFLGKTSYVAGDKITLADFSILASLTFASEVADYSYDSYSKISAWLQKMKSEVPNYKEINEDPLKKFKEELKSKK